MTASTATGRKRWRGGGTAGRRDEHRLLSAHDAHSEDTELAPPGPLSLRRTVNPRSDPFWVAQVRVDVECRVDADRDHVAHRRLSGPRMRPGAGAVRGV